ncbi:hypothetical protein MMC07_004994 [Pseudocyphellaria aurata]|nr:hypothetical protein [Pseudocyphellaria aurata]
MSCADDGYRVQIWNPTKKSSPAPAPVMTSPYYPRHAATPVPTQTATNTQSWRVISPPRPPFPGPKTSPSSSNSVPSVKHLTCYFWAKNGVCKWSDEDCLYAHYNTGKTANGPLQVEPGRPAVAGKNATNARPVYEDWRGGQEHSRTKVMYRSATIDPEIQEQIYNIAAKERARCASKSVSQLSLADSHLEHQMQTVGHSIGTMSSVLQQTLVELHDITAELRTYGFEILELARALDREKSPHLTRLTTVAQGMIATMSKSSNAESVVQQIKETLMDDLERVGLDSLVPDWESSGDKEDRHHANA